MRRCLWYDACIGGGQPGVQFGNSTCTSGTHADTNFAFGYHGTGSAAIAVGNANSACSAGIAPQTRLAGCPMIGILPFPTEVFMGMSSRWNASAWIAEFDIGLTFTSESRDTIAPTRANLHWLNFALAGPDVIARSDISSNRCGAHSGMFP